MKQHIPNLLTALRLVLSVASFAAFLMIGSGRWPNTELALAWFAVASFVIAAVTDFFDGYLARRWKVVSVMGAILDPIGDKILVCGGILGLIAVAGRVQGAGGLMVALIAPGGIILFREFAVSALREVLAPRGLKLPVTFLAKTKTTLQLAALTALMIVLLWPAWGLDATGAVLRQGLMAAEVLYWLAAVVTLWTGLEYGRAAAKALAAQAKAAG